MKQVDVKLGETYYTRIGEELAAVQVIGIIPGNPEARWPEERRTRFRLRRTGEDKWLPKLRPASALRTENKVFW